MAYKELDRAKTVQGAKKGWERFRPNREARRMFIESFAGQYYAKQQGFKDEELINLLYTAIRTMSFRIVMRNPVVEIHADVPELKDDADSGSMELSRLAKRMKLDRIIRQWVVDSFFGLSVAKVGIQASQYVVDDGSEVIDPGEPYVGLVDLDNFIADPTSSQDEFSDAFFVGDIGQMPRAELLRVPGINKELVNKLPPACGTKSDDKVRDITDRDDHRRDFSEELDEVRYLNLWFPKMEKLCIAPHWDDADGDEWLLESDYEGPDTGPYVFLNFAPPVPGNPMPIAQAGIWYDLHRAVNRVFKKYVKQAINQKQVTFYEQGFVDDIDSIRNSDDDDYVAANNAAGVETKKIGGVTRENTEAINYISQWFNFVAGNPEQAAGLSSGAGSATEANILAAGAGTAFSDATAILYDKVGDIMRVMWFYKYTDPLADFRTIGRYYDFSLRIKPKSMSHMDDAAKSRLMQAFATQILPSAANALSVMGQMGIPFNIMQYMKDMSDAMDLGAEVDQWFNDPTFAERTKFLVTKATQDSADGVAVAGGNDTVQNRGDPTIPAAPPDPDTQQRQEAQTGANESQRDIKVTADGFYG